MGAKVKGNKVEWHKTVNHCFDTRDERTDTRPVDTSRGGAIAVKVAGGVDPQKPGTLGGVYPAQCIEIDVPTGVKVEWNLTRR